MKKLLQAWLRRRVPVHNHDEGEPAPEPCEGCQITRERYPKAFKKGNS